MNFDALLETLQGTDLTTVTVYSTENRNMLDHETEILYFLTKEEAIRCAEEIWSKVKPDELDCWEVSVHLGELEESDGAWRFVVLKKLFKAYKQVYVVNTFLDSYLTKYIPNFTAQGLSEEEAKKQARQQFNQKYTIQKPIAFGMFADYDYAPQTY